MILRKPYAILIRHFKLIHVIFALIALFLFLKCNDLLSFIEEYIVNSGFIVEDYQINELLPFTVNLIIIFGIILNIIIALLLKLKDKKITFYIFNIIVFIALLIGFTYTSSILNTMQTQIVDTRLVRALRDIFNVINIVQIVSLAMYAFRATGFDVKKFNFTKDLMDLQIEETDNEEVEVAVDIDLNKIDRNRRKNMRMLKYFYFEHKFWCDIAIAIFSVILVVIIIFSYSSKDPIYNQFQTFNITNYGLQIEDVYITNKDKNGSIVEEGKSFVIVEIKVKKNNIKSEQFNVSRLELKAGGMTYHNSDKYKNYFDDFGTIYTNQELGTNFKKYFLIYRVNSEDLNKKTNLVYIDNTKDIIINFKANNLSTNKVENLILNESKKFENTILNGYEFTINKFEINDRIKLNYKYCINSSICLNAVEYIVPTISTNYDKVILRIDGALVVPEDYNSYVANMEMLLTRFGYLNYSINGKSYTTKFLGTIKPSKVNQKNTIYLEIKEEILKAEKIVLGLKIRNQSYELVLKEGEV